MIRITAVVYVAALCALLSEPSLNSAYGITVNERTFIPLAAMAVAATVAAGTKLLAMFEEWT